MPPEVRSGGGACTEAGDMWMLGALAWLILTGPLPQPGMSQEAAWASIMVGKPSFKGEGWAGRSAEAVDFVSRLLQVHTVRVDYTFVVPQLRTGSTLAYNSGLSLLIFAQSSRATPPWGHQQRLHDVVNGGRVSTVITKIWLTSYCSSNVSRRYFIDPSSKTQPAGDLFFVVLTGRSLYSCGS